MKKIKRLFSLLLAVCICLTALPVFAFALPVNKTEGPFTYTIERGYAVITDYDHSVTGELVIPEKLGGYPVGAISRWKFQYDDKITSVVLPEGFLYLGELAFASCPNLTEVTLPDSLCGVGRAVFKDTPWYNTLVKDGDFYIGNVLAGLDASNNSTEIVIKDGTTGISDWLFSGNTTLEKVTLPESCKYIGEYTFNGCTSLKEITMPDEMIWIGQYAFGQCSSLEKIDIPTGIDRIYNALFFGATALKEIQIPQGVAFIGSGAFSGCSSLTSVVIPEGVERIQDEAFGNCAALSEVSLPLSMKVIDTNAFKNSNAVKTLNYSGTDEQYSGIVIGKNGNESILALKEQDKEIQKNTPYIPCSFDTTYIPRGTSAADFCKAAFEPLSSVDSPGNNIYPFDERLEIIVSSGLSEKGLENVLIGDVDNNGSLDASDARSALRSSVGLEEVDFARIYTADIDNDKTVTAADARMILRASVDLEDASLWK